MDDINISMRIENMTDEEWKDHWDTLQEHEKQQLLDISYAAPQAAPMDGPQMQAFNTDTDILIYGGAAGGGKTGLGALKSIYKHTRIAAFRNHANELRGVIDNMLKMLGSDAGMNRSDNVWDLSKITGKPGHFFRWAGIADPDSEKKHQGIEDDFKIFDESPSMALAKINYLRTWKRTPLDGQKPQELHTLNPPASYAFQSDKGLNPYWIMELIAPWVDKHYTEERFGGRAKYGEHRFVIYSREKERWMEVDRDYTETVMIDGKEATIKALSCTFIRAKVTDNKYIMQGGGDYIANLNNLPEPFRSQMLMGDFRDGIVDRDNQLFPAAWIDAAFERWNENDPRKYQDMDAMGVDTAKGGVDKNVVARRHGLWWDKLVVKSGLETPEAVDHEAMVTRLIPTGQEPMINVDENGKGGEGLLARLIGKDKFKPNHRCYSVKGQKSAKGMPKFLTGVNREAENLRCALYYQLSLLLDPQYGHNIALPPDTRLKKELIAHDYLIIGGNRIQVEKKADVKKKLGSSPDRADAVVYSLAWDYIHGGITDKVLARVPISASKDVAKKVYRGKRAKMKTRSLR